MKKLSIKRPASSESYQSNEASYDTTRPVKRRVSAGPRVEYTDESCVLDGMTYPKIPMLVDAWSDIIVPPTDWLRNLTVGKTAPTTVDQYAHALNSFWKYIATVAKCDWGNVSDTQLRTWRNRLLQGTLGKRVIMKGSINAKLEVVLQFYRWAQEHRYVEGIIGLTSPGQQPLPIRLVARTYRGAARITSDLLYRLPRRPRRPIPTKVEIDKLYEVLSGPGPESVRDCLIVTWASGSGMRRIEILNLKVQNLPSPERCFELLEEDKLYWLTIIGKGQKERQVPVAPEVLIETHDFIGGIRQDTLKKRVVGSPEDAIFLSSTTGKRLNLQYISRVISSAFKMFTDKNRRLTLHRLRGRFTSLLVQQLMEEEECEPGLEGMRDQLVMEKACYILGLNDVKTIRHYLNLHLDREDQALKTAVRSSKRRSAQPPLEPLR
jgi:site-specific recombinase XerD